MAVTALCRFTLQCGQTSAFDQLEIVGKNGTLKLSSAQPEAVACSLLCQCVLGTDSEMHPAALTSPLTIAPHAVQADAHVLEPLPEAVAPLLVQVAHQLLTTHLAQVLQEKGGGGAGGRGGGGAGPDLFWWKRPDRALILHTG